MMHRILSGSMAALCLIVGCTAAFSLTMTETGRPSGGVRRSGSSRGSSRRSFLSNVGAAAAASVVAGTSSSGFAPQRANAAAAPEILQTPKGIKYATLQSARDKSPPLKGDLVAIEYTGYLTDGTIFDATHSTGKNNALLFELGGNAVIDGINEMVENMGVGQKVQAIIPPELAFGDKGLCIEKTGECLIKPKSTLVYDILLKRAAIPPP